MGGIGLLRLLLCAVLAASTLGAAALARRAFRLPAAFCPAAALAGQTLALYGFALAGLLRPGVYAVTGLGLAAFAWYALRDRGLCRALLEPGPVFFLGYLLLTAAVNGAFIPTGYDNYTHWAVIVKELCLTHALPGPDTMTIFTNYPPAAALYEYFLLQFLGFEERWMVLALNALGGAMAACLFAEARWTRLPGLLARLLIAAGALMVIPDHFRDLYVDAVLGLILLAMGAIALWDSDFSRGTAVPQALLGALLILTKMSGAMLLILHAGLLLTLKYRRADRPPVRTHLLWLGAGCAAAWLSFRLHTGRVFGQALAGNQFRLSLSGFTGKLAEKSPAFWEEFPGTFLHSFLDRSFSCSRFFLVFNLLFLAVFLAALLKKRPLPARARGIIPFGWLSVLLYSLCLAAMYIFMMSEYEGRIVASFDRYFGTVVIWQTGLTLAALLPDGTEGPLPRASLRRQAAGLCLLACCTGLAGRPVLFPPEWRTFARLNQAAANEAVFAAARQTGPLLEGERPPVLACMSYGAISQDLMYRVLRYAFWQDNILLLTEGYWEDRYWTGQRDPFYLLWLGPWDWAEEALARAGIPVPQQAGLYYKGRDNSLTLVREILL